MQYLNNKYLYLICCSNFCWKYCSPSSNHFPDSNITFFNINIFGCANSFFILKLLLRILPSIFLTPIHCLGTLLYPGGLTAAAAGFALALALAAWRLWSCTILAIIFVLPSFLSFTIKDFNFLKTSLIIFGSFNESMLLCNSSISFAAIVIRISGILPLLSLVFCLFNSASNNKLKITQNFCISYC